MPLDLRRQHQTKSIGPTSMERLTFFPIAIITALISIRLNLTYVGFAMLIGLVLPITLLVRRKETYASAMPGYAFVVVGLVITLIAYLVCLHYGISFEALDQDRSFSRVVRRLPYFGLTFLSAGITALAIFLVRRLRG